MGHWGLGDDGTASFALDLRTGKPAGRFLASNGHDVMILAPLSSRGILAMDRDTSQGMRLVVLDTCGKQLSSIDLAGPAGEKLCFSGNAVVGQGEIAYVQVSACAGGSAAFQIVAIDGASGRVAAGPSPRVESPWVAGADGTLYAADLLDANGLPQTRIVALSPTLQELYHVDIDGGLGDATAVLADDGILYAQTSNGVVAIQTTSPGLAQSSWPTFRHDNRSSNWGGGQF
jgi:hypothetical protein